MTTTSAAAGGSLASTIGRYRWLICSLLFLATTVNYIDRQVLALIKSQLDTELGWTNEQFGQVNAAFHTAADAHLKGILRCTEEPVVSHDVIGENASCLLDTGLTRVAGRMVKVFGWYDNEWGYAQRTVDLVEMVARLLPDR